MSWVWSLIDMGWNSGSPICLGKPQSSVLSTRQSLLGLNQLMPIECIAECETVKSSSVLWFVRQHLFGSGFPTLGNVRSGLRIVLPEVTQCDVSRDKIRILKHPPTPKKPCIFKLLATIEGFPQIKTHKYTKQITSHACSNYQCPFRLSPFCSMVAIQGHLLSTLKLPPPPYAFWVIENTAHLKPQSQ